MTDRTVNSRSDDPRRLAAPRRDGHPARRRGRRAFTLVELLIVILIIGLLMGIMSVSLSNYLIQVRTRTTQSTIQLLSAACDLYHNDFKDYPLSDVENGSLDDWKGAELLPLYLVGWAPDEGHDAAPGDDFEQDDGQKGNGFRIRTRGDVYGPYNGAEEVKMAQPGGARGPLFIDSFGQPIVYYRVNPDNVNDINIRLHNLDAPYNGVGTDGMWVDGADSVADWFRSDNKMRRADFVLASRGHDGLWGPAPDDPECDDVTNFDE